VVPGFTGADKRRALTKLDQIHRLECANNGVVAHASCRGQAVSGSRCRWGAGTAGRAVA